VPLADTVNALTTTLPAIDASLFIDQLDAGNLLGAIGDPIAADVALIPFAVFLGAGQLAMRWKAPCSTLRTRSRNLSSRAANPVKRLFATRPKVIASAARPENGHDNDAQLC
jgi:hypothetical protein